MKILKYGEPQNKSYLLEKPYLKMGSKLNVRKIERSYFLLISNILAYFTRMIHTVENVLLILTFLKLLEINVMEDFCYGCKYLKSYQNQNDKFYNEEHFFCLMLQVSLGKNPTMQEQSIG